jgi:hypothetical protein
LKRNAWLCFSMYEDGQKPGDIISQEQVQKNTNH